MTQASRPATAADVKRLVRSLDEKGARYFLIGGYGVPVRTVSLEGLMLTKQSQRPQDIQDALILRRAIEAKR
jgi:hypothetical protein